MHAHSHIHTHNIQTDTCTSTHTHTHTHNNLHEVFAKLSAPCLLSYNVAEQDADCATHVSNYCHTSAHINTHTCTHIHKCAHTHTHTHTHTHVSSYCLLGNTYFNFCLFLVSLQHLRRFSPWARYVAAWVKKSVIPLFKKKKFTNSVFTLSSIFGLVSAIVVMVCVLQCVAACFCCQNCT